MRRNKVIEKLKKGETAFGGWSLMGSLEAVEMMGYAGFDFVIIDRQHTYYGLERSENLFRAAEVANITPIVRVPDKRAASIMKALDAGALGILVPTISTVSEVREVVKAAKYPPQGERSACPETRAVHYGMQEWKSFVDWSNENTMVWLLVEGPQGVANFREIVKVEGVDVVMIGPFDLSQSLGHPGEPEHPEVVGHFKRMLEIARESKVEMATVLFEENPQDVKKKADYWIDLGCKVLLPVSDRAIMKCGLTRMMQEMNTIKA